MYENVVVTPQVVKAPYSGNEGRSVGGQVIDNPESAHEWGIGAKHSKVPSVRDACSNAAQC